MNLLNDGITLSEGQLFCEGIVLSEGLFADGVVLGD